MHKLTPIAPTTLGHIPQGKCGFTFIELTLATAVMLVALSIFAKTVTGMARQGDINRANALASVASSNVLERMRNQTFSQVFALYNEDANDDPGGPGTAPGSRFGVPGLDPTPDAIDGLQGHVFFPTSEDGLGVQQLREDLLDATLGLPRDLSGDSIIDAADHSGDYFVLPVGIRVRWKGTIGQREFQMVTLLCAYRMDGP